MTTTTTTKQSEFKRRLLKQFALVFSTRNINKKSNVTIINKIDRNIKKKIKLNDHQKMLIQMEKEVERNIKLKTQTLCISQVIQ
jgi:hypothetical protein